MGTCRMGVDRRASVVSPTGECWDLPGLFVCDASVLPTCSGVNPMITTLEVAHVIAEGLANQLTDAPPARL